MNSKFHRNIKVFLLSIFICSAVNAIGQHYEQSRDGIYKFSEQILRDLEKDSVKQYTKAAHEFSFIGDYKNALLYGDMEREPYPTLSTEQIAYFQKFKKSMPARQYIQEKSSGEQIIIINEGHHLALHRVFAQSLLQGLYDKGFRYFGAETLDHADKELNQRDYPVLTTGFYTSEPQYGELIRTALAIGYEVFAYEANDDGTFRNGKEREIRQAENIKKILQKDSQAKILVHAGYDHIREDSIGGAWGKAMAGRLHELTGINPFTINQEILTERSKPELDNPYLKLVNVKEPTIFVDEAGKGFAGSAGFNAFDVRVFHPKTSYIHGRPDWMFTPEKRPVLINRKIKTTFPCLVFAYKANEDMLKAIPVDVIELKNKGEKKALALKKGKYNILVKDKEGKLQNFNLKV